MIFTTKALKKLLSLRASATTKSQRRLSALMRGNPGYLYVFGKARLLYYLQTSRLMPESIYWIATSYQMTNTRLSSFDNFRNDTTRVVVSYRASYNPTKNPSTRTDF